MGSKLKKVVRIEIKTRSFEFVRDKGKATKKDGSSRATQTTVRVTTARPEALLECGHWRHGFGTDIRTAKRLSCWECGKLA